MQVQERKFYNGWKYQRIKKYAKEKTKLTLEKVDKAIRELSFNGEKSILIV